MSKREREREREGEANQINASVCRYEGVCLYGFVV